MERKMNLYTNVLISSVLAQQQHQRRRRLWRV